MPNSSSVIVGMRLRLARRRKIVGQGEPGAHSNSRSCHADPFTGAASAQAELCSMHALGVECICKGNVSAPYEFVRILDRYHERPHPSGQSVLLQGLRREKTATRSARPSKVIEALTGRAIERVNIEEARSQTGNPRRVFISDQKRGVFGIIKRELRRHSVIEPVIGHMKRGDRVGRCRPKGSEGPPPTPPPAVGHNLRLVRGGGGFYCARC